MAIQDRNAQRKCARNSRGFTLLELITAVGIFSLIALIAAPNMALMRSNLDVTTDRRMLSTDLQQIRSEAIRKRTGVTITFTTAGYSWTVSGESSPRATRILSKRNKWQGGTPDAFTFNGLGLVPALSAERNLSMSDGNTTVRVKVNPNGRIDT